MPAAESIVLTTSGWMVSPLIARCLNELVDSSGKNVEKVWQELRTIILPWLELVIEKMEGSRHRSKLEEFLQRLKDDCDDWKDMLDRRKYKQLKRQVAAASRSKMGLIIWAHAHSRSLHSVLINLICVMPLSKHCLDRLPQIKLSPVLNKQNEMIHVCGPVQLEKGVAVLNNNSQATSLPPGKVFGRDEDRDEIIRRLEMESAASTGDPGSTGIPVIAIVGRPGVGKTTLAQHVCLMLRTKELSNQHFDLVLWVNSSCSFELSETMKDIILQVSNLSENVSMINSLEVLQKEMGNKLKGKKFLLVINDVWYDMEDQQQKEDWDTLFKCLNQYKSPGSKILVTSQKEDAPRKIATAARGATLEYTHYLKELEENDFLDLFMHYIQLSGEIDSSIRKYLEEEFKTIAKKLNKDPTAAKIVGETISSNMANLLSSQGNLRTIAEKDWSGVKTKALMWSYQHLPANLPFYFLLLSLYPRDHKFKDLEVVQLWMAQEFIKSEKKDEEDACIDELVSKFNGYIDELVYRFYIQRHNSVNGSFGTVYTVNELFYDLVKVSCNGCFRIEGNGKRQIPSTICHLSIPADKMDEYKEEICKLERLCTLIITSRSDTSKESVATDVDTSKESVATDVFKNSKNLHVLISEVNIENLAEFISKMKLLRILQVPGTSEFVLPESVCTLYLLQVLNIQKARSLPKHLDKLVSLRYLASSSGIANIGNLTSLRGVENFQVRKEKGYELKQLQSLNDLQGRLCITNLENVESKESAIAANLKEKKDLVALKLAWQAGGDNLECNSHAEVLEGLNPPPNLTTLHLDGYGGQLWPSWLKSQTSDIQEPHSLKFLFLENCSNLSNPLAGTNLARSLINISIKGCRNLERLIYVDRISGKRMLDGIPVLDSFNPLFIT